MQIYQFICKKEKKSLFNFYFIEENTNIICTLR